MAQRYFTVDDEHSSRKVALLCCGLFFVGAFVWFILPMAMRVLYPDLHSVWPALANPSEAAYAVASLTLLPYGLIGVMLAAMFSATMANLSAQFNLKSAILTKDVYQKLLRKSTNDRELLLVGWINTLLIGASTTALAAIMAASGKSVFQIMLTFNNVDLPGVWPARIAGSGDSSHARVVGIGVIHDRSGARNSWRIRLSLVTDSTGGDHRSRIFRSVLSEWTLRSRGRSRPSAPIQKSKYSD
jgi:hypothetical protein